VRKIGYIPTADCCRVVILSVKRFLCSFNIENLVLRARSEFNGFAGAGANRFGVLEFWSIGVLAKTKARILLEFF
jgi:hypothetical protein